MEFIVLLKMLLYILLLISICIVTVIVVWFLIIKNLITIVLFMKEFVIYHQCSKMLNKEMNMNIKEYGNDLSKKLNIYIKKFNLKLKEKNQIDKQKDIKFLFTCHPIGGINNLLNANSVGKTKVNFTINWIDKLNTNEDKWKTAFVFISGHEIGHKTNEPFFKLGITKKGKFVNWVRESRADFIGMKFACFTLNENKIKIINAMNFWNEYNDSKRIFYNKKFAAQTHPYWQFREKLLTQYDEFNEQVIKDIAKELSFNNEKYISKITKKALF